MLRPEPRENESSASRLAARAVGDRYYAEARRRRPDPQRSLPDRATGWEARGRARATSRLFSVPKDSSPVR
jgi:hypothetical protein